jgi:hypothetical protein
MSIYEVVLTSGKRFEVEADRIASGPSGCTAIKDDKDIAHFYGVAYWADKAAMGNPVQGGDPARQHLEETVGAYMRKYSPLMSQYEAR